MKTICHVYSIESDKPKKYQAHRNIHDLGEADHISLFYYPSEELIADITKQLPVFQFEKLRALAGMCEYSD